MSDKTEIIATRQRRRAASLVRSLVVAAATLAILLVCFTLYEYTQEGAGPEVKPLRPRLPALETAIAEPSVPPPADATPGPAVAGEGRDVRLTLYPRKESRARVEIAVRRWMPVSGSTNEFLLVDPEIRLRTNDDRAVRLTAEEGWLEARQKSGGSLDAQRGRLIGAVVIEIDRLTGEERALLPEPQRQKLDPSQIVRVTAPEIEFDLEFSKLTVPRGELHASAEDFDFRSSDLEVRFNEEAGRVEYLRINEGGRIELNGLTDELGVALGAMSNAPPQQTTLVDWMRNSLQAALDAQKASEPTVEKEEPLTVSVAEDGTPVFRTQKPEEVVPVPPVRYLSRFEDEVDVRQLAGETTVSRLTSDSLSIKRAFSSQDRKQDPQPSSTPAANESPGKRGPDPRQRILLSWSGRLVIESCLEDDDRCNADSGFEISAVGSPTRLTSSAGNATCRTMDYAPDTERLFLGGDELHPVRLRSPDQSTLTGTSVTSQRSETTTQIRVTGPGRLVRDDPGVDGAVTTDLNDRTPLTIEFKERLDAETRFVDRTWIDLTTGISKKRFQVLDRATFLGNVALTVEDTNVQADGLTVEFGTDWPAGAPEQTIERVKGRGHVLMTQRDNRIACGDLDLILAADEAGQVIPVTLTAKDQVEVVQEDRAIHAVDELIIDFAPRQQPANTQKETAAVANASNSEATRAFSTTGTPEIIVARLRGSGTVHVVDPQEGLDLRAERLDCTLIDGERLDEVVVQGTPNQPASIDLDTFAVSGSEILLYVADQRADVPTDGVMTFVSLRDLDGRKIDKPIPVSISWSDWMSYDGRRNRAVLQGTVRASSNRSTTFECDRMEVEFEDSPTVVAEPEPALDRGILNRLLDRLKGTRSSERQKLAGRSFSKELTTILAKGHAVALTSDFDPETGFMKSRARISGPMLSVNLNPEVSKMLIEGAGDLLLEDFRPAGLGGADNQANRGLFAINENAGPSKTLIRWDDVMSYDFSIDQTRFEGAVRLTYVSGSRLDRMFQGGTGEPSGTDAGRSTFLKCGLLTVDFLERGPGSAQSGTQRMGRLSADRLRQFHASRKVELQDPTEGLALKADDLIFEKDRNILLVEGSPSQSAHIVLAQPGEFPREYKAERFFYDLKSNRAEASRARFRSR